MSLAVVLTQTRDLLHVSMKKFLAVVLAQTRVLYKLGLIVNYNYTCQIILSDPVLGINCIYLYLACYTFLLLSILL